MAIVPTDQAVHAAQCQSQAELLPQTNYSSQIDNDQNRARHNPSGRLGILGAPDLWLGRSFNSIRCFLVLSVSPTQVALNLIRIIQGLIESPTLSKMFVIIGMWMLRLRLLRLTPRLL